MPEQLNKPEGPRPDVAAQFQRVLDLMYQKGRNLSQSERNRMETCYVLGAQLSMVAIQHAINHPIDSVGHKLFKAHQHDIQNSIERVEAYK